MFCGLFSTLAESFGTARATMRIQEVGCCAGDERNGHEIVDTQICSPSIFGMSRLDTNAHISGNPGSIFVIQSLFDTSVLCSY